MTLPITALPTFLARDIPPRTWLVEGCIPHPSIGMLYAWRGTAKTYTAMQLALDLAQGAEWMGYTTPQPRRVLYVDGEMPLGDMHIRLQHLAHDVPEEALWRIHVLASEDMAAKHTDLNLATPSGRKTFEAALLTLVKANRQPDLIIFDNWTSLIRGIDENDNSALDPIKQWFITLRHGNCSVLIIHHSGKEGRQRGASSREDNLDYSLTIEGVEDAPSTFLVKWDKTRTGRPTPSQFTELLVTAPDGRVSVALIATPEEVKRAVKRAGSVRKAAAELGLSKSKVGRMARGD